MKRLLVAAAVSLILWASGPAFCQVQFSGKVWTSEHLGGDIPPSRGFPEDYFAPGHPGTPAGVIPLPGLRGYATPAGSDAETAAGATWATHPQGWYYMEGAAGNYTILFTGPVAYVRPILVTNVIMRNGEHIDRKFTAPFDYKVFSTSAWDEQPAHAYYQLFIARGTSVTSVGFKVAHDGVDGGGPEGQNVLVSVHRVNEGDPQNWEQMGPTTVVPNVDSGGPKNYEWIAAWNSGEVPLEPGETFAVRLMAESDSGAFQVFWRDSMESELGSYRIGPDGTVTYQKNEMWMAVTSDGDGLLIPYNKHIQKDFVELAGFARSWSQTYVAQGYGLAGVVLYAAADGTQPSMNRQRIVFRVRRGGPDGPVVGISKIGIGNGIHTGDASWGTFGTTFAPGEAPLVPGQTYAIEMESMETFVSLDGYVNIKNMPSTNIPGFNPYRKHPLDRDEQGTAYHLGVTPMDFDLDMQILEYEHPVEGWENAIDPVNLVRNGDMEEGDLLPEDPDNGTVSDWKRFTVDEGTTFQYIHDPRDQGSRIVRLIGGSVNQKTVDGGYVQRVAGLNHGDNYRLFASVRGSYRLDPKRRVCVGYDLTGQDENPQAESIIWTRFPEVHSIFLEYQSDPIRPENDSISIWLRGTSSSIEGAIPFKADFDNVALHRIYTGIPRGVSQAYLLRD